MRSVYIKRGKKLTYNKPDLQSSDLALLQYTGGTTGVAKGAALSHRNLIANIEQVGTWMSASLVDGKEITITPLPLYHVFALTVNCFGMMRIGAKSVLITDPRKMKDFIKVPETLLDNLIESHCIYLDRTLFHHLML